MPNEGGFETRPYKRGGVTIQKFRLAKIATRGPRAGTALGNDERRQITLQARRVPDKRKSFTRSASVNRKRMRIVRVGVVPQFEFFDLRGAINLEQWASIPPTAPAPAAFHELRGPQYSGAIQAARRSKRRIASAPMIALESSSDIHLPTLLVRPFSVFECSAMAVPATATIANATTKVANNFMGPVPFAQTLRTLAPLRLNEVDKHRVRLQVERPKFPLGTTVSDKTARSTSRPPRNPVRDFFLDRIVT
jgi:hypothetical protein